ncbi:MAG: glycerol-3-phosphate 1-O-acyltransferase PlsY [Lentimicrobiaceae bacterium]|nr:glycerol-3-phosphate 1-O-acyltransferase PlsY [Lentimicrobiaceae bacterium]
MGLYLAMISGLLFAYLVGAIPTAVWVGRWFYGVDVRKQGSGNAGATNTIRVLGLKAGIPVLLFDICKGWLAVYLGAMLYPENMFGEGSLIYYKILLGVLAVIGHVFPIYVGFKGGKGVAVLVGIIIALFPEAFIVALVIFVVVFVIWRYVSLASITAALFFPVFDIAVFGQDNKALMLFSLLIAVFVPITHHKNVRRLLRGEENRFDFKKKKN